MGTLTVEASGLRSLLGRLVTRKVINWSDSNTIPEKNLPKPVAIGSANIVSSNSTEHTGKHMVVLDIDHLAYLVKSSTPGHFHLYIDVPDGIEWGKYLTMLHAMASAGVIEPGYANAAEARGFSAVRLPWIKKETN